MDYDDWTSHLIAAGLFSLSSLWMMRKKRGEHKRVLRQQLISQRQHPKVRQALAVAAAYWGRVQREPAIVRHMVGYLRDMYGIDAVNFCRAVVAEQRLSSTTTSIFRTRNDGIRAMKAIVDYMEVFRCNNQVQGSCIEALTSLVTDGRNRGSSDNVANIDPILCYFKRTLCEQFVLPAVVEAMYRHDSKIRSLGFKLAHSLEIPGDEPWNVSLGQILCSSALLGSLRECDDSTTLEEFWNVLQLAIRSKPRLDHEEIAAVDNFFAAMFAQYTALRESTRHVVSLLMSLLDTLAAPENFLLRENLLLRVQELQAREEVSMAQTQEGIAEIRRSFSDVGPFRAKFVLEISAEPMRETIRDVKETQQLMADLQHFILKIRGDNSSETAGQQE